MARNLRVKIRFYNAVLQDALEAKFAYLRDGAYNGKLGIIGKASKAIGLGGYSTLSQYLSLQKNPYHNGNLKKTARKISDALDVPPLELFPIELYGQAFPRLLVEDVEPEMFLPLCSCEAARIEAPPVNRNAEEDVAAAINLSMAQLSDRERLVLEHRFGFKGDALTYEEIAPLLENGLTKGSGVTRERVRKIEAKALRKMRHPSRFAPIRRALESC